MFGAGGHPLRLYAPHIARRQLARKIRVLGKILEAAAAQRAALGIQARAQQHIHPAGGGFLADGPADRLAQGGVPAVGDRGGRGEAGGRLRWVQTQMIGRARLLAQAVGPIRKPGGRYPLPGIIPRLPGVFAGEQGAFLLDGKFFDDLVVFHSKAPFCKSIALLEAGPPRSGRGGGPVSKRGAACGCGLRPHCSAAQAERLTTPPRWCRPRLPRCHICARL